MAKPNTFDDALRRFVKSNADAKEMALVCARMGLEHFAEHGDVVYLQRFHDAMVKNWNRRAALVRWACSFAPLDYSKGAFSKRDGTKASDTDLTAAAAEPFWDFSPELEVKSFTSDSLVIDLEKALKRFENAKRSKPADDAAVRTLEHAKRLIAQLRAPTNVEAPARAA